MSKALLPITYLGNIEYFSILANFDNIEIEVCDNYARQTYRNRATILTANGTMDLTIPVVKPKIKTYSKDIEINEDNKWSKLHISALASAYGNSPYWEYYQDDIVPIYEKKHKYLFDLNIELIHKICELLNINCSISESFEYKTDIDSKFSELDFRYLVQPKSQSSIIKQIPYHQVFKEKFGFTPNLSIIDLLLNLGPESLVVLKNGYAK